MEKNRASSFIKGVTIAVILSVIVVYAAVFLITTISNQLSELNSTIGEYEIFDNDKNNNDDIITNDTFEDDTFEDKNTGDLLRYNLLSDEEKVIYRDIYNSLLNVSNFSATVTYTGNDFNNDMQKISNYVIVDNPQIFYTFGANKFEYQKIDDDEYKLNIEYEFYVTKDQATEYIKQINSKIDEILATNDFSGYSDYEKALWCCEWLCDNVEYNYDIINDTENKIKDKNIIWRSYGAIIKGSTVCMGYSEAFQMMMYKLDVPCTTVSGIVDNSGHEWNVACLDGINTHIDVTWSDQESTIDYKYFGQTEEQVLKDKTKPEGEYWPECTSTAASYYEHNKKQSNIPVTGEYPVVKNYFDIKYPINS